jgi:hypothetical protein
METNMNQAFYKINMNDYVYVKPLPEFLKAYKKHNRRQRRVAKKMNVLDAESIWKMWPDKPDLTPEGYYKSQLWTCLGLLNELTGVCKPTPIQGLAIYLSEKDVQLGVDLS